MKDKSVKYNEAILRNFASFRRGFELGQPETIESVSKETLESLKQRIGIKKQDTAQDTAISAMIAQAKGKVEARAKAGKTAAKSQTA